MKKKKIALFLLITMILSNKQISFAAVNDAGAINTHAMDMLKQNQLILKEEANFKEINQKQTKENLEPPVPLIPPVPTVNAEQPVIKATVEEYQSKGVYIEKVVFSPSQILSQEEIAKFVDELSGKNLFMGEIQSVINEINNLYAEKGYVTAKAILPEQTIENGELHISLVEGKVGNIAIKGNKWTKSGYISKRMSENPDKLFKISDLEKDILDFNRYNESVKLKATLDVGQKPETTDITITATEKSPFHFTTLWDNAGRTTIGKQRTGFMLSDDSLFGYRDRLTLGTYLTDGSTTPFADYNVPINNSDGRLGFSFSSSLTRILSGNYQMFDIKSRSFNYSLYYSQPLVRKPLFELTSVSSINYKQATTEFDGQDLYTDKISSFQTGLNARYDSKRGIWYASQDVYHAFPIFSNASKYFKMDGNLVRLHDFGHNIVGQFRGMYQWSPKDVMPYVDQFQSGGLASVRGFSEGLLIGKTGYLLSAELLFPIAPSQVVIKDKKRNFIGKYVKGVFFVDHSGVFPYKGTGMGQEGINCNDFLTGIGPGLRISLPADATARLYWGFPLGRNTHEIDGKVARFHFEISLMPDFDKILRYRKRHPETL